MEVGCGRSRRIQPKKNCSLRLTSCCRGVKCSGFPSWEEGKKIHTKFKKKKLCSLILVSVRAWPGTIDLTSLHSIVHDFLFLSGIDTPDPMSGAAYGSGLRALSADSTKKIVPIVLLVAAGV